MRQTNRIIEIFGFGELLGVGEANLITKRIFLIKNYTASLTGGDGSSGIVIRPLAGKELGNLSLGLSKRG